MTDHPTSYEVPVIAFVASSSGSGKSTLVESLVGILGTRGYRVGTVKHSAHEVQVDKEGSDSWRFIKAGAVNSVIVGPNITAVMRHRNTTSAESAIRDASLNVDIVLVEGFKKINLSKVEVYRKGHSKELLYSERTGAEVGIVAVATDAELDIALPILPLDDPEAVCDFIEEMFLSKLVTDC